MKIFGFTIARRQKAAVTPMGLSDWGMSRSDGGWFSLIREPFTGAWQKNISYSAESILTFSTVYACLTLIATDVAKLWVALIAKDDNGIWTETENPAYSPVLRKPNHYQNRIQFFTQWMLSKLIYGNTYVLLERDGKTMVQAMYILDASRVKVLQAPNGEVFYDLSEDYLSGVTERKVVPASEIIHDRMPTLYHPLIGISPLSACWMAATQGLRIQQQESKRFENGSHVDGVLTSEQTITDDVAQRLRDNWIQNYAGPDNVGKIAVLGNGLKFDKAPMLTAQDAQIVEQLKLSSEMACTTFHVPPFKVGVGAMPSYNNVQALNQQYYTDGLQFHLESLELCLDEGLRLGSSLGVQFDVDSLLRMDTLTATEANAKAVGAGFKAPNEARRFFDLPPVTGGDTPYLQQQNYSLAALDRRDTAPAPSQTPAPVTPPTVADDAVKALIALIAKTAPPVVEQTFDLSAFRRKVLDRVKEMHVAA